jgi:hypothetical protein
MNEQLWDEDDEQGEKDLQDRAVRIIQPLIPRDAEDRVSRAFRQWNQIVREHIRNETALRLTDGDARTAIPVRVVEGFPLPLANLIDGYRDRVLWRLILGQQKLGGIIEGLNFFLEGWAEFESWPRLPEIARNGQDCLERTRDIAAVLQQLAVIEEVRQKMKQFSQDILGVYRFGKATGWQIELYWMAIAMVAAMLDVRLEDLTVVVLAHELTHGYTHLGRDIDGDQWEDGDFRKADLSIIEGLAQFYTETVVTRMEGRVPGPKMAYERLLNMQSGPYLAHREWLKADTPQKGEIVRFAMVMARRNSVQAKDEWQSLVNAAKQELGSRGRGRT